MEKALIFSIEEFSVFDGPGIRTTVFIKGCPLRCEWCHNPEGQSLENSVLRTKNGCLGCGECAKRADSRGAFTEESIKNCPMGLLRHTAEEYSSEELVAKLEKNLAILNSSGGGITFSGGEPLFSSAFLLECLKALKDRTHRAVQTSGYSSEETFKEVLENCDYMLFDLKLASDREHKLYTGVSNTAIHKNLKLLAQSKKEFVIRIPLIPGVTDTDENITGLSQLLSENGIGYAELLPYNKLAGSKYPLVNRVYSPSFDQNESPNARAEIFSSRNIEINIL